MYIRGGSRAVRSLLDEASQVQGSFFGGTSPWSDQRMDGRMLLNPLAGLGGNGVEMFPQLGSGEGGGNEFGFNQGDGNTFNYNFPDPPDPPPGDEYNFYNDEFYFDNDVPQVPVTVVSDIQLSRSGGVQARFRTIICQADLGSVLVEVIPTEDKCL